MVLWFTANYNSTQEQAMAPHSSPLAWKIPWTEEPAGLQSMGSLAVGHDWATSLSLFTFMHWRRKWQPTPVFLPGESQGQGAWWPAVYGVPQSQTRLKWLSSSSSAWLKRIHLYSHICSAFNLLFYSREKKYRKGRRPYTHSLFTQVWIFYHFYPKTQQAVWKITGNVESINPVSDLSILC